jgi:hypothetical protein
MGESDGAAGGLVHQDRAEVGPGFDLRREVLSGRNVFESPDFWGEVLGRPEASAQIVHPGIACRLEAVVNFAKPLLAKSGPMSMTRFHNPTGGTEGAGS